MIYNVEGPALDQIKHTVFFPLTPENGSTGSIAASIRLRAVRIKKKH